MITCGYCHQSKPEADFNPSQRGNTRKCATPKCRVCHKSWSDTWREEHPDYDRQYHAANRERANAKMRENYEFYRGLVFDYYGWQCACCASTDQLQIDHVNGGGKEQRIELTGRNANGGSTFYKWLVDNNFPLGFQTLCKPCNQSKGERAKCSLAHETDVLGVGSCT